jgi:hypothetical protein
MSIRGFVNRWPILGFVPAIALSFVGCSGTPTIPGPVSAGSATGPSQRATAGNANGNTPFQLSHIGWSCLNVPGHGVHCLDPHFDHERASNTHYQVKVFDTADPSSDDATFRHREPAAQRSLSRAAVPSRARRVFRDSTGTIGLLRLPSFRFLVLGRETSVDRVSVLRHIRTDDALRRRCDEDARGHADTQSRSYGHGRNFQFSVREMGVNQISTLRHIRIEIR